MYLGFFFGKKWINQKLINIVSLLGKVADGSGTSIYSIYFLLVYYFLLLV